MTRSLSLALPYRLELRVSSPLYELMGDTRDIL
jgi:hypothetical protein